ncbi:MAG: hypothetical protein Q7S58_04445 [Candidatus Binatus sp.]|uniref:hypothetical protein n=1 Tax=Candidatus Binatus sp. TaxID=2811406 RepID=UPI002715D3C6|nr:hypothetical protein [Candidatus Binatus sp.]MDO8431642.1 hypothetical protein [Candidatus Binatus sp.]
MKLPAIAASIALITLLFGSALAAGDNRINVVVACQCADEVGQDLCKAIRTEVAASPAYRLQDSTKQYGLGLHLSCTDAWKGINAELTGHMSAVAITFTIYSQDLPGEVYEDSSVFRVGKDAVGDVSGKITEAIGQLVKVNAKFFEHERSVTAAAPAKPPTAKPSAVPTMHELTTIPP